MIHLTFTPVADWLLVEPAKKKEEMTASGLFLPSSESSSPIRGGTVVSAGPGAINPGNGEHQPMWAEEGSEIIFMENSGVPVMVAGEPLLLLRDSAVIALVSAKEDNLIVKPGRA